jgi:serine/threonine protein kinase/Tol biopolymer transport system component
MGEVYRARDTRLDRIVAIKVLPTHLSANSNLRQRFEREAKAVSALNHPNICALYDVGHHNGTDFLVMEYIDGETLLSRLRKGPLSTYDLLQYSIQIADGLDKAHRQGIIHRDLKPGNIMLTKSGAKLLDFGLAKKDALVQPKSEASDVPTASNLLTGEGTILGTLAYMAPEQLEGKEADARTDIFAFGAVLYEMATAKRAFEGNSQASLISAIMSKDPPPPSSIQPLTPPALDQVVKTCLAKDPDDRIQNAHDLAIELRWMSSNSQAAIAKPTSSHKPFAWIAATLALLTGFAAGYFFTINKNVTTTLPTVRSVLTLPQGTRLAGWASPTVAFSPDGRKVAYVTEKENGVQQLYIQELDKDAPQLVPGSDEAEGPFFSPDSEWVAFAVGVSSQSGMKGELKKYSLSSGLTQSICDTTDYFGGSWTEDGNIIFTGPEYQGLWRVPAAGGTAEHFGEKWKVNGKEVHRALLWPQILPGNKKAVVIDGYAPHGYGIAVADLDTLELKDLGIPAAFARYSASGHLLYSKRDAILMAVPFDVNRMMSTGPSVALLKELCLSGNDAAVFALSQTGSLVYLTGYLSGSRRELSNLLRVDQKGQIQTLPISPDLFDRDFSISPDGRRLAIPTWDGSMWIYDVQRGTRIKIVDGNKITSAHPLWTPDQTSVVFASFPQGGGSNLFWQRVDGTGTPELLIEDDFEKHPSSWTTDGKQLVYEWFGGNQGSRINLFNIESRGESKALIQGRRSIRDVKISPDGKWIAYASGETGKFQIYVERFPELGQKVQISIEGGINPYWSRDGKQIFYRNDDRFMAVPLINDLTIDAGPPRLLFQIKDILGFDVFHPTGEFFVLKRDSNSGIQTQLHLVTNWFPELQRLAPSTNR